MRLLFLGDVYARPGRDAVIEKLQNIKKEHRIDYAIVNGENAAQFGIMPEHAKDLLSAGSDCITTGNHGFSRREIIPFMEKNPQLIRPVNYPEGTAGQGVYLGTDTLGRKILTVNVMGRAYMEPVLDCPFRAMDKVLQRYILGGNVSAIFVDVHAEVTAEKQALAHYLDGRVSAVIGTHTHMPTADAMILPNGTAYQTDAGMCGAYSGVIGAHKDAAINRFLKKITDTRLSPEDGEATICGVVIDVNNQTGRAQDIYPIRIGGMLKMQTPYKNDV